MNQVALIGNITDDPELRYTQSGAALAGFTVAVSHRSTSNGQWQDVNDGFFRCTAWRSVAENAAHTLKKGMRIFVCRQARPAHVAGRRRQQASERRDPGDPRRSRPPVRHRGGRKELRRRFPGRRRSSRVTPPHPASSEPGSGRAPAR